MITITFGWWLVPFAVSVVGFLLAKKMNSEGEHHGGFMDMSAFFSMVTYVIFFIVPSLIAWLIWALLK